MTENTFIFLKPDAVERKMMGKIISRFEEKGFNLIRIKTVIATEEILKQHYEEHKEKSFFAGLVESLVNTTVVCMVWQGPSGTIAQVRTMVGDANPEKRLPGTIRGDYSADKRANLIHSSDSVAAAERETNLWGCV